MIEEHLHCIGAFIESARAKRLAPREVILAYGRAMLQVHQTSPHFVRILGRELLNVSPFLQEVIRTKLSLAFRLLCEALREGVRSGAFRADLDLEKAVIALAGCVNFYFITQPISRQLLKQDDAFAGAYLEQALEIFLSGIERRD